MTMERPDPKLTAAIKAAISTFVQDQPGEHKNASPILAMHPQAEALASLAQWMLDPKDTPACIVEMSCGPRVMPVPAPVQGALHATFEWLQWEDKRSDRLTIERKLVRNGKGPTMRRLKVTTDETVIDQESITFRGNVLKANTEGTSTEEVTKP